MSFNATHFARMHTINRGGAHLGITEALQAEQEKREQEERDARIVEEYLAATAPKAYAYAGGRILWDHKPVQVRVITPVDLGARFGKMSFTYLV